MMVPKHISTCAFPGMGLDDFNGHGYFYVRISWTGFSLYILRSVVMHVPYKPLFKFVYQNRTTMIPYHAMNHDDDDDEYVFVHELETPGWQSMRLLMGCSKSPALGARWNVSGS